MRRLLLILMGFSVLIPEASVEARGRRLRCLPYYTPQQNAVAQPCYDDSICPMYVWMSYGSYCSYYSLRYTGCMPLSYDSTNCGLQALGCDSNNGGNPTPGQLGCVPPPFFDVDHPGHLGYSYQNRLPLAQRIPANSPLPGSDPSQVTVTRRDSFVITFRDVTDPRITFYAQVFIADVTPMQRPAGAPASSILARGLQIDSVADSEVKYSFVANATVGSLRITPMGSHGRAYILAGTHEGRSLNVPIILHFSANAHRH